MFQDATNPAKDGVRISIDSTRPKTDTRRHRFVQGFVSLLFLRFKGGGVRFKTKRASENEGVQMEKKGKEDGQHDAGDGWGERGGGLRTRTE